MGSGLPALGCFFVGRALLKPSASAFRDANAAGDRSSAMSTPMTASTSMAGPSYVCKVPEEFGRDRALLHCCGAGRTPEMQAGRQTTKSALQLTGGIGSFSH